MNLASYLTPYTKIISKWIKDLKVSKWTKDINKTAKTIKLLKENIGERLHDVTLGNNFLDFPPKAKAVIEKNKVNWISSRLKNCASKDTISRMKR